MINDLYQSWSGEVRLILSCGGNTVLEEKQPLTVASLGQETVTFTVTLPAQPGAYQLTAELVSGQDRPVQSLRDFNIVKEK